MSLLTLFDTPIFVFDIPETEALHAELAQRLTAERQSSPGIKVSNRGGWHSIPDLALRPDPVYRELGAMLAAHFRHVTEHTASLRSQNPLPPFGIGLTAWAMVMEHGHYTVMHDHPEATWSSAYYADAGDSDYDLHPDSGALVLIDPRRATGGVQGLDLFPGTFELRPTTGMLVIFPGWLQHYVHPYRGHRPRVAIAANASIRLQP